MLDYSYFKSIQGFNCADDIRQAQINDAKLSLMDSITESVNCVNALRNGTKQKFVITESDNYYKYNIQTLPGEELFVGDSIEYDGEHYIVMNTHVISHIQTTGLMWLCNWMFRWQNAAAEIVERWGILDSGVYSTTKDGNDIVMTPDTQYKIYLPGDGETEKLYIDKRLATSVLYDKSGAQILGVHEITGVSPVSKNYGKNAHLLILDARSADYIPGKDNVSERICDYTPASSGTVADDSIRGPSSVHVGSKREYTVAFNDAVWSIAADDRISFIPMSERMLLSVPLADDIVGSTVTIRVESASGEVHTKLVEVIA